MSEDSTMRAPEADRRPHLLRAYLSSPFAGLAPWILMSLVTGPGRFDIAVWSAFALSLATFVLSHRRGSSIKPMEVFDLVFFFAVAVFDLFADAAVTDWLELWAGELTNVVLTLFVLVTILIRQPFTLAYARETTPAEYHHNPLFIRINYVITWVWAGAFAFQTAMGLIGDALLHDSGNYWTGWVLQYLAVIFAFVFTDFYPDYATARVRHEPTRSLTELIDWLPVFVLISGAAGLILGGISSTLAWVMVVVGAVGELVVISLQRRQRAAAARAAGTPTDTPR